MYIGLGLYYAGVGTGVDIGWKKKNTNLRDMIRKMKKTNTEGYSMFAYTNLLKKTSKKEVKHYLKEVSWIELNKTRVTLKKKDTCQLQASWQPVKFTAGKTITFESENPKLATVDADGLVTAVAAKGKVKIIAKSMGKTASCTVTLKSAKK